MAMPGDFSFDPAHIKACVHCGLRYDWRRSPSGLKMTYCGSLCEAADLGFTIDALLQAVRAPRPLAPIAISIAA